MKWLLLSSHHIIMCIDYKWYQLCPTLLTTFIMILIMLHNIFMFFIWFISSHPAWVRKALKYKKKIQRINTNTNTLQSSFGLKSKVHLATNLICRLLSSCNRRQRGVLHTLIGRQGWKKGIFQRFGRAHSIKSECNNHEQSELSHANGRSGCIFEIIKMCYIKYRSLVDHFLTAGRPQTSRGPRFGNLWYHDRSHLISHDILISHVATWSNTT